ncbi:hypothetical protein DXB92_06985 [Ruminococcus sp. OM06-36AC]|nr:hypothetical protein DXB92_06985 [Ruminococcus sp. OM06-36AC]
MVGGYKTMWISKSNRSLERVQKQKSRLRFSTEPVFCLRKRFFVGKNAPKGNATQRASGDFARHLLANFPSYFTKMLVNTSSIHSAFCFI